MISYGFHYFHVIVVIQSIGQFSKISIKSLIASESAQDNWLLTYRSNYTTYGKALYEKEVENILIQYDLEKYEQIFGEVEEA